MMTASRLPMLMGIIHMKRDRRSGRFVSQDQTRGIMAFDDYHRRGWWGDGVIRAVNEFLGQHPRELRIRAIAGAQIAIEKIVPQDDSKGQND